MKTHKLTFNDRKQQQNIKQHIKTNSAEFKYIAIAMQQIVHLVD